MFFLRGLFLFFFLVPACCLADLPSETVYLTWQHRPDSSMTIQWISLQENQGTTVSFRTKSDSAKWEKREAVPIKFPQSSKYILYRLNINDLESDTEYFFKIPNNEQLFQFKTAPLSLNKEIRFVEGGDMYHDGIELMEKTCKQAAKTNPLFALLGGDIAYAVGSAKTNFENIDRWIEWVKTWHATMVTPSGNLIPVISSIGNHDLIGHFDQKPEQAAIFSTLFPMPGPVIYNVLDFGSYLTILLMDSGHANPINGKQMAWLQKVLQERQHFSHQFAAYHVPAYTSVRSYKSQACKDIRRYWVPLFEKYGIQTVFEHHDHAYKRTFPLLRNKINPLGIVYLGDGAWGVEKTRVPKKNKKRFYIAKFISCRHFLLVTLTKDKQLFQCVSDEGVTLDQHERKVI